MPRQQALEFAHGHKQLFIAELSELIRIPSVSTMPEYKKEMEQAAKWLAAKLTSLGFRADLLASKGPPAVWGEWNGAGPKAPTLLVYGHYDVQPAEPLDEWTSGAFEPEVRGEYLFGRGASDMKGQILAHIFAVESMLASDNLPINIKYLIEGEEEIGSPNLSKIISTHRELIKADVVLNGDTMILQPDLPTLIYGLRGLAYFELRVITAEHDLHSGLYGGGVPNAGQILCELIAGMHDASGTITLPGFYDDVLSMDNAEREELARVPYDEPEFLRQSTAFAAIGEPAFTMTERLGARPTLEVNGLLCGFTEEGSKTVLPSKAMAKISMRLVPDQDPEKIQGQLCDYIKQHAPNWLKWEVIDLAGGKAALVRRDTPEMQAAIRSLEAAFGTRPIFNREGGSVPVVSILQDLLGKDSIMMGFGLPDDNIHAPDERLHLPTIFRGVDSYIHFAYELSNP